MKRIIFLLIIVFFVMNLHSQETIELKAQKDFLIQKSKRQYATGWILLGTGTTMTVVGGIGFDKNFVIFGDYEEGMDKKADTYGFIMLTGLVFDIVSLPVFISASRNKKKGASIVISNQITYQSKSNLMTPQKQTIPSLTLRIEF